MLVGDVQVENVLGDELVTDGGELMRIATLTSARGDMMRLVSNDRLS